MGDRLRWGSSLGLIDGSCSGRNDSSRGCSDVGYWDHDGRFESAGGLEAFLVGGGPNLFSHEELFSQQKSGRTGDPLRRRLRHPGPLNGN